MNFLTREQAYIIDNNFDTPVYVYSEDKLDEAVNNFLLFPSAFGHDVRFAMKAKSNVNILKKFNNRGIKIDGSSEYEAFRALNAGFKPSDIQISGQETPRELEKLLDLGVFLVATSLDQIKAIGEILKQVQDETIKSNNSRKIGVRINPGMGSGAFKAISTGGETSAFGIWHEFIPEIKELVHLYDLEISKIHIHIGSENTPESWTNSANIGLDFVRQFPNVTTLDMGGGFKMAIMPYEKTADLQAIGKSVAEKFTEFYNETGRKIHLELEPGKYMVINSGCVVAKVDSIVNTGINGYKFIRTNTGMTEMPRVAMYGVQQPITIINDSIEKDYYVVVGHCCESGDILTTKLYDQEVIETVELNKASVGDIIVFDGTGAYNSSMSMKNYNSFPEAGEILIRKSGEIVEIRKREKPEDVWRNEIEVI
ncbi:MAG: diaminopimelate decarboxylase [Candidatus Gracilibacteria bacterium]|nr:diaminopimelate decarboxylase [Candidatus Gracilibacteria bacterium]